MEFGDKLKDLEMTPEEVERFSQALKNDRFKEMLHEYAEEISNPENKKKYEEEISQLEQERGMEVKFIHPKPHHVLKTSMDGKEKCFINICSNTFINKPTCVPGRAENGQAGQHWSLPYSLTPGRPDRDNKGKTCTIYDVVFHPDTLHMASKNPRLRKLVDDTAIQGVEGAFKVKLDRSNAKSIKMQYKGAPYAAVLRKPIPGYCAKEPEAAFQEPYPKTVQVENHTDLTVIQDSSVPTEPKYTVTYRSAVDLQDYRSNRDSAPSPRPKEIIVTIDLPLVKTTADVDLDVTEKTLTLKSQKPAYNLELRLSYPVEDDRGVAKFNKSKKQLTITLPVKPSQDQAPCGPWGNLLHNEPASPNNVEEIIDKHELVEEMAVQTESSLRSDDPAHTCEVLQDGKELQSSSTEVRSQTDLEVTSEINKRDQQNEQKISDSFVHKEFELMPNRHTPGLKSSTMTASDLGANICMKNAPCQHEPKSEKCKREDCVLKNEVSAI